MSTLRYKPNAPAVLAIAITLALVAPIRYRKESWGPDDQTADEGDYLVQAYDGEVYTVKKGVFETTYAPVEGCPGTYKKFVEVTAFIAEEDGFVETLEGRTEYAAGDYVVTNPGGDVYAMRPEKFLARYVPVDAS